jgi:hypothetical protein
MASPSVYAAALPDALDRTGPGLAAGRRGDRSCALWEMAAQPCWVALEGVLAATLETNMGDAWRQTMVAVVTEFGCTRAPHQG